uniref:ABC transporter G family member 9-like n=1 Tax=Styela clava TaxID=7725 RepID=UPI001939D1BB|nr:ABC transporter G family member 9-like [Styela clava]
MPSKPNNLSSESHANDTTLELMIPDGFSDQRLTQPGQLLKFEHLNLSLKGKKILQDVSGCAHPGKVFAVMGPSGSGKTTLLNIIGGRIHQNSGKAWIGGQPLTKQTRRKISYVLQNDIFFANLTLGQTLMFSAELRLSEKWPRKVKEGIVKEIVDQLEIDNCMNTIIGNNMIRGLSGGEKKRANIANELLTDPAVLLLDEPTSGLDSATAYGLIMTLKQYAVKTNKTVLMTVHQPSSQMFFLFDTILLLTEGKIAYYGSPNDVLDHFAELGHSCDIPHYNPADFILDMTKLEADEIDSIISSSNKLRLTNQDCPIRRSTFTGKPLSKSAIEDVEREKQGDTSNEIEITTKESSAMLITNEEKIGNGSLNGSLRNSSRQDYIMGDSESSESGSMETDEIESRKRHTWATSFWKQLRVLTQRSFIQGKARYFSKLKFIKCIGVALIAGLMWFQIGVGFPTEDKIRDITALYFFSTLYSSFDPLFDVLQLFPSERTVINKERMAGSYRLSAYYLAKLASELPLTLMLPTIYTTITYWMAGLNGLNHPWTFFGYLVVILTQALAAQSLGLFISAATLDFDHGLVLAVLMMMSFLLVGGFYVKNLPTWLTWFKYVSPITHAWSLGLYLEFDSDNRIICDPKLSSFQSCKNQMSNGTISTYDSNSTGILMTEQNSTYYVAYQEILEQNQVYEPAWVAIVSLLTIMCVFRLLGYICLRLFHKPVMK